MAIALIAILAAQPQAEAQSRFLIRFTPEVHPENYTGRVYVLFSSVEEPRQGPNWFRPGPMLAADVDNLAPGEVVELVCPDQEMAAGGGKGGAVLAFPKGLQHKALAGLRAQAVVRFNPLEREVGTGPGNGFSAVAVVPTGEQDVELVVDKTVPPIAINDNEWTRAFRLRSELLSQFHGRPVEMSAAVRLPPSYATSPERRYPVVYEIPGFGGALRHGMREKSPYSPATSGDVEFIHVFLDPNCPLGHHVFADSANNGPVGQALVEEFIPALDQKYRTVASPKGRFLTGHSSGGWSSLWLQVTYPETFNGTWSTAPDPVDFHAFQRIDLYRDGENMYVDRDGQRRPLARVGGQVVVWYDDFARMEDVLGPGGQLHSFEAVFSRRGADGKPQRLWNRETGVIDRSVAETWKRYDIRLLLEENWSMLGPKLAGKLHVFMGDQDTFYLEEATRRLKESLEKLGSDAIVEMHPGADHSTLMTPVLRSRITREMSERYSAGVKNKESAP